MIEIKPRVFFIPGENKSRFPFCSGIYLKGRRLRVLVEAGMGHDRIAEIKKMGLDAVILSHCHIDHRSSVKIIPDTPIWSHPAERRFLTDPDQYLRGTGFDRSGISLEKLFPDYRRLFSLKADRPLTEGQEIDLGGLKAQVVHTPGHSPGHISIFLPDEKTLFTGDVDLSLFGPFYGHCFSDVDHFEKSIFNLSSLGADIVAAGHGGLFLDEISGRFNDYLDRIRLRDEKIIEALAVPSSIPDLTGRNLIYPRYPRPVDLMLWFEEVHLTKHLTRLEEQGLVRSENGLWRRLA